jgi:FPC/CPF motif-containing protein YcgG
MMNESLSVAIAGQSITTVGSQGFANGEVGLTVRGDLTKRYANDIATGFSEQLLPYVMAARYGSVDRQIALVLETDPPKDKAATARALTESASAISALVSAVTAAQAAGIPVFTPNLSELMVQFGIPKAEVQTAPAPVQPAAPAPAPEAAAV